MLGPAWCRFRSGAATAVKTCPSPTASPRRSSAASKSNGRFGAAGHQGALRPRLTTVISPTSEPLFSQLPVAANRSRLVLHAHERTLYTPSLSLLAPCPSSSSPQVPIGAKARARISHPCKAHPPSLMFVAVPWRRGNVSIQILPIVRTRDMFDSYQAHLPQANRALAFI